MNRPIDKLITTLKSMFRYLNSVPLDGNQFHAVREAEVEFQEFLSAYRSPDVWISQDGQTNKISELSNEHLANVIRLLDRQSDDPKGSFQPYEIERYGNLQKEAFKRRLREERGLSR